VLIFPHIEFLGFISLRQDQEYGHLKLSLSEDAYRLVSERHLEKPCIKISLVYKAPVCTSSFCKKRPFVLVSAVDESSVDKSFVKVVSDLGLPVYIASPLFELANRQNRPVSIKVTGIWRLRKLVQEGLDPYRI